MIFQIQIVSLRTDVWNKILADWSGVTEKSSIPIPNEQQLWAIIGEMPRGNVPSEGLIACTARLFDGG
jgi:hypothetical protein